MERIQGRNFYSNSGSNSNNNGMLGNSTHGLSNSSFQSKYPSLKFCSFGVNREVYKEPVMLPLNFDEPLKSLNFSHDFSFEINVLKSLEDERRADESNQIAMKVAQQEAAWRAIEEKRKQNLKPKEPIQPIVVPSNPDTLIDLNFEEETLKRKEISTNNNNNGNNNNNRYSNDINKESPNPKKQRFATPISEQEQTFSYLLEMGMNPEISLMAVEIFGSKDLQELIQFITDFQILQDKPEKFSKDRIKSALLYYKDCDKTLQYLQFSDKFLKRGATDQMIKDALELFPRDMKQATTFVQGCMQIKELGFPYELMKSALISKGNDIEQAIVYCLENK